MFRFIRLLRLRDLEIIEVVHNSVQICLLIIEDKRRTLNDTEKLLTPYNLMDEGELKDIHNVLYLYLITGEELTKQQNDKIIEFADDLLHEVIPTAKIVKRFIDKNKFSNLPLSFQLNDFQDILRLVNSHIKLNHIDECFYLSQE